MITITKVYPTKFLFGNNNLPVSNNIIGDLYDTKMQTNILTNMNNIYEGIVKKQTEFSSITDDTQRKQFQEQEITLTQSSRNIKDHLNRLKNFILKLYGNNQIKLTYEELADSMENIQKLLQIFYPEKEVVVDDSEYTSDKSIPLMILNRKGGRTRHRQNKQKKNKKTQKKHKKKTNKRKQKRHKKTMKQ